MKTTLLAALLLIGSTATAQTFRPLISSTSNCVNDGLSLRNYSNSTTAPEQLNRTTFNVGYWGDPGTAEAVHAVTFPISWPIEQLLNTPNYSIKRGYYDVGLPTATSGITLSCYEGASLLNSYQFSHTQPVQGGGPQAGLGQKTSHARRMFTTPNSDLVIQGYFKHPAHHWNEEGAEAQIIMAYYVQPLYCPFTKGGICPAATLNNGIPAFAHVIALYSSTNSTGTYNEFFGNDTFTGFFSSPLSSTQANGAPTQYLSKSIYSYPMATRYEMWNDFRFYRAHISRTQMQQMIAIQRNASPQIAAASSPNPDDWGIVLVTGLQESFPGTGNQCTKGNNPPGCRNISMAVSQAYIEAYEYVPTSRAGNALEATGLPLLTGLVTPDYLSRRPSGPAEKPRFDFSIERARTLLMR